MEMKSNGSCGLGNPRAARTGFTKCFEFEGRWFAPASSNNARAIVNIFGSSRGWLNVRECLRDSARET